MEKCRSLKYAISRMQLRDGARSSLEPSTGASSSTTTRSLRVRKILQRQMVVLRLVKLNLKPVKPYGRGNVAYRHIGLQKRFIHQSPILKLREENFNNDNARKFDKEIRTLKQLKDEFGKANIIDKLRIQAGVIEQQAKMLEIYQSLQEQCDYDIYVADNTISSLTQLQTRLQFTMTTFKRETSRFDRGITAEPPVLLDELKDEFNDQHKDVQPITSWDILTDYRIYYELANSMKVVSELRINNSQAQEILNQYSRTPDSNEILTPGETQGAAVSKEIVTKWFEIFDIFSDIPVATNKRITSSICPEEFEAYLKPEMQTPFSKGKKDIKVFEIEFGFGRNFWLQFFLVGGLFGLLISSSFSYNSEEITMQDFFNDYLTRHLVDKLVVTDNKTVYVELNEVGKNQYPGVYYFTIGSVENFENALKEYQNNLNITSNDRVPVVYSREGSLGKILINFVPTVLFLGAIFYMSRRAASSMGGMNGPLGFGKSTAKKFNQETDVKIRFKDVAGMTEAKEEVMEFVKFLKNPEKYEKLGAKIPRGAILSGPPGTGKTLIAKAIAGEANVPFFSVSGSEFVEMFVGVGASRVRDLFKTARENAPSIVFVDEIDAIGKARTKGNASGSNDERETTLNQLLVEMDGFESHDHVVVLAGTNRADILDKALMRPGRFDRHITIDNPELSDRKEIFDVHLQKITLIKDIDHDLSGRLAALTPGFSGADIANVCNEAALIAARFNAEAVKLNHFELAIERVIGGIEKKSKVLSPEERKIVAYHEAGHAICGWFLQHAHPLLKVSIVPRGLGTLGYAQYLPPDQYLLSTKQIVDRMVMTLGGRVSEELNFQSVTGGAHDDFKKVTQMAQLMVLRWGMSPKVGMVNYADTRNQDDLTKPFSDETNKIIDEEIKRIVSECYAKCKELLKDKSAEVKLVAEELLKKEFITRQDMIRLLGKRPFPEKNDAFDKYLDSKAPFQA